eukprot:765641-Hanusia_phi.AAC.1
MDHGHRADGTATRHGGPFLRARSPTKSEESAEQLGGPSRQKQLACLQASIRLVETRARVVGSTGEEVQL